MTQKQWFVCPIVRRWDDMETNFLGQRYPFSIDEAGVGFLDVYESYESYNAQYPNIKPWVMVTKTMEDDA